MDYIGRNGLVAEARREPGAVDSLLKPLDAAAYMGTSTGNLAQHRYRGTGPKFVKFGRAVRYRLSDIEAYVDANTFEQTGAA